MEVPSGKTWGVTTEIWTPPAATPHKTTALQLQGEHQVRQNDEDTKWNRTG